MSKELEFSWKCFINTGLKVKDCGLSGHPFYFMGLSVCGKYLNAGSNTNAEKKIEYKQDVQLSHCTPLIVDPKNLSDEKLQYIFGVNFKVNRKDHLVYLRECRINLNTGYMHPCDQQILNRFYSLHSIPNYEELLKDGLIEDAGDCYKA